MILQSCFIGLLHRWLWKYSWGAPGSPGSLPLSKDNVWLSVLFWHYISDIWCEIIFLSNKSVNKLWSSQWKSMVKTVPGCTVTENFVYLGDVSSWTSSHVPLIKEELLAATAMKSGINRTLIIKRIAEGSTCVFVLLSHWEATSCS